MDVDLYFDLASPYAYMAVFRAEALLGRKPRLRPMLLGAFFPRRGYGSWALTPQRELRVPEIEARALGYGLPPIRWPEVWPPNSLAAMRAAVWADERGALEPFARGVFHRAFALGEDAFAIEALVSIADEAGLPGGELPDAVASQDVKDRLRALTDAAWDRGVRGIPTAAVGEVLIPGDDQLEQILSMMSG